MTRGIRNNNPLNIVLTEQKWQGKVTPNTDGKFEQFTSMAYGFRAAIIILKNYMRKHKLTTIAQIVARWCPDSTQKKYVYSVCQQTGWGGNEKLICCKETLTKLAMAMAVVECGNEILQYKTELENLQLL